jgi:competence ComEA-like helix-hairpin-helix protein
MRLPSFTPREAKALVFLLVVLVIGGGITLYKRGHPDFAPELVSDFAKNQKASSIQKVELYPKKPEIKERIHINRATAKELELLPGVGPVLAKRIISLREDKGGFKEAKELVGVVGIGSKKLEEIEEWIIID